MNMAGEYDEPAPTGSYYESMSTQNAIYKATQIRPNRRYIQRHTYPIKNQGRSNNEQVFILSVIQLIVQVFVFAMMCYFLVSHESRDIQKNGKPVVVNKVDCEDLESKINQLTTNVETLMNTVSFIIPRAMRENKVAIEQRLQLILNDLKEIMRASLTTFQVSMGNNRSVHFKTGRDMHGARVESTRHSYNTITTTYKPYTIMPGFYPIRSTFNLQTKLDNHEITSDNQNQRKIDIEQDDVNKVSKLYDYLNLAPYMK